MKVALLQRSRTTGNFIQLARAIEGHSTNSPTESLELAKLVIFTNCTSSTIIEINDDADLTHFRALCAEVGVECNPAT